MTAICPSALWRPVTAHSGPMAEHRGLVVHVQVGGGSCYPEFVVPANQASSTWWAGKAGELEQYVDADFAAWTEADGNFTWDSIETEGEPEEPLTALQIVSIAVVYRWGAARYGWPFILAELPTGRGLGWHGMGGLAWGDHPGCPGDLRRAQRGVILAAAAPTAPAALEEPMAVTTSVKAGQLDTLAGDPSGRLIHRWWNSTDPAPMWRGEILATGLSPGGRVEGPALYGGVQHFFAPAADGGQAHVWYDGHLWGSDHQPPLV